MVLLFNKNNQYKGISKVSNKISKKSGILGSQMVKINLEYCSRLGKERVYQFRKELLIGDTALQNSWLFFFLLFRDERQSEILISLGFFIVLKNVFCQQTA